MQIEKTPYDFMVDAVAGRSGVPARYKTLAFYAMIVRDALYERFRVEDIDEGFQIYSDDAKLRSSYRTWSKTIGKPYCSVLKSTGANDEDVLTMITMGLNDRLAYPVFRVAEAVLAETRSQVYLFNEGFWNAYKRLGLDDLTMRDLFHEGSGLIVFPTPIPDGDGSPIEHVWFQCRRYDGEFASLRVGWDADAPVRDDEHLRAIQQAGLRSHESIVVTAHKKDFDRGVFEYAATRTWELDRKPHLVTVLSAIAYINSGQPDVRVFKNLIRTKGPGSDRPIKKDQHLSPTDINLVGYSWLKDRQQHTDEWTVEPYVARRWYGPGKKAWKVVVVAGSTRSHKRNTTEANLGNIADDGGVFA